MTEAGPSNGVQHATLASLMLASGSSQAQPSHHVDLDDPSSASNRYLQSLTSKSLSDLRGQPAALSEASNSLNTQLSSLCTQYVSSFVQVHQATSSLPSSLATLDAVLDNIVNRHLPALSSSSQQFSAKVESSLQAKEKAQNLILQYELSLKDLMDIPKLLMTCVRANHPVEALLLAVHMMKIERKGKFASTIRSLQDECWVHLRRLQDDLLRGLGARGLRLPAAKRIVSLLRKFKEVDDAQRDVTQQRRRVSMSDSSICISFLCSRWALLEESTSNASSSKSSAILSAQLSTWRDVVGDTCGMAQTLFSSDNNGTSSEEDELSPTTLIASFSRQALSLLQRLLSESVPSLPEDSINLCDTLETLAALHTQLSYSAASLSRQGLDISRVVSGHSIFSQQVTDMWTKAMRDAREEFDKARQLRKTSNSLTWVERETAKKLLNEPLGALDAPDRLGEVLKQFPDLRLLANHILDSYNALLSFAPLQASKGVTQALDEALLEVCSQLFEQIKSDAVVDIELSLNPIMSTNAGSRYYEKDATRLSQANLALLARMMSILCGPLANHLRSLIRELFGRDATPTGAGQPLDALFGEIAQWCEGVEQAWLEGERLRQERVRKEEEDLAAEELKKKQEEEERLAELERRRAEEAKRREAEEAERQRIVEKERAEEEERLRIKVEEERKREAEELKKREEERLRAEEAKRKAEKEEATRKLQEEEAKRREETEAKEREAAAVKEKEIAAAKEKEEAAAKEKEIAAAEKEREAAAAREGEEELRKEKERQEREAEQKAKEAERERQKADEESSRKQEEEAVVEPAIEKPEEKEEGAQGLEKDEHSTEVLLAKSDDKSKDVEDAKDTPVETAAERTPSGDAQTGADQVPVDHAAGSISSDTSAPAEIMTSVQIDTAGDKEEGRPATSAPDQAEDAPPATTGTEARIVTPVPTEKESDLSRKGSTSTNKLAEKLRQRQEQRQKKAGGASAQPEGT